MPTNQTTHPAVRTLRTHGSRQQDDTVQLGREIAGHFVPLGAEGKWTQARQQFAVRTKARWVAVSKTEFYAAIGHRDAVTSARSPCETNGSGTCSTFELRDRQALGRIYTGKIFDQEGQPNKLYLLETTFAARVIPALERAAETVSVQEVPLEQGPVEPAEFARPRGV